MDSFSSSSSSSTSSSPAATDNSPSAAVEAVDDDGASSPADLGLAKEASFLFQSGNYVDCLEALNQLLQKKPDDLKIAHNIAITESFRDGCPNPKKILDALRNTEVRIEDLTHASDKNVDNNIDRKAVSKGSTSALHTFSPSKNSAIVYRDVYDNSVVLFNMAVIWSHLHEHAVSFSILDVLFQNIQPINEAIALRICLLLLDVGLLSQRASRCMDVLNYMETAFCVSSLVNQVDNGYVSQQSTIAKLSISNNLSFPEVPNSESSATMENSLSRTLSDEVLEEDEPMPLLLSLDIDGPKLAKSSDFLSSGQFDESILNVDLRLKWHLYKVHLLLLTRNLKAAKREIKMAMNMVRGSEQCYPMALYLKSQLEYARGNHRKAVKLLMASSNRTEMGSSSIYYNNLGCIYFRQGKYHTSNVFFSKALSNSSSLRKEKPSRLSTFSQDKSLLIVYNSGVKHLSCGKPFLAARCFQKASSIFYNRPLLWLRIAECCLSALQKGLLNAASSDRYDVRVLVIGKGKWRDLVLQNRISEDGPNDNVAKEDSSVGDGNQPCLSLSLARWSLHNALYLLDSYDLRYLKSGLSCASAPEEFEHSESISSKNSSQKNASGGDTKTLGTRVGSDQVNSNGVVKDQKSGGTQNTSLQISVCDYEDICRKENQIIRQALLADLAYVELELGNPEKALSVARSLLKVPGSRKIYTFIGSMYAAEALCLLNRPKEAAEHLSVYVSDEKEAKVPYSQEDCDKWRADKNVDFDESNGCYTDSNAPPDEPEEFRFLTPAEAHGTLYANLAAMSAAQGDFEQASQFVIQALAVLPNNPDAICTAVYVDLMCGKAQEALVRLRQCNRTRFKPGY